MLRREGSSPKATPKWVVVLGCVPCIVGETRQYTTIDHAIPAKVEAEFTIEVQWIDEGSGLHRQERLSVPITDFPTLGKWISKPRRAFYDKPVTYDQAGAVINTIRHLSQQRYAEAGKTMPVQHLVEKTGWVLGDPHDFEIFPATVGEPTRQWRYVHGDGYIVGNGAGGPDEMVTVGSGAVVRLCPVDPNEEAAVVQPWIEDWILGGLVDRNDRCVDTDGRLRRMLCLAALSAARSLLPHRPARGPLFVVGLPGSGKTLLARTCRSHFDPTTSRPNVSLVSTVSGVETELAAYGDTVVVLDDYLGGDEQWRAVDHATRGVYDRAVKARATASLQSRPGATVDATVWITGEQLPVKAGRGESTLTRMLVLPLDDLPTPWAELLDLTTRDSEPQRQAIAALIAHLARRLDSVTPPENPISDAVRAATETFENELHVRRDELHARTQAVTARLTRRHVGDRTTEIVRDLLLGGAFILQVADDLGLTDTNPNLTEQITAWISETVGHLEATTTQAIARENLDVHVADMLRWALADGTVQILPPAGTMIPADAPPPWAIPATRAERGKVEIIGRAEAVDGHWHIHVYVTVLANYLRRADPDLIITGQALGPLLRRRANATTPTPKWRRKALSTAGTGGRVRVDGVRSTVVVVPAEVLGIDCGLLGSAPSSTEDGAQEFGLAAGLAQALKEQEQKAGPTR